MEKYKVELEVVEVVGIRRVLSLVGILALVAGLSLMVGIFWAGRVAAEDPKVVYPDKTDLDFEGIHLEGEVRNPGEFYFERRVEEKFDSLVKRRKNFHREMLRDVVLSK